MSEEEIINFLNKGINANESMINTISNYSDKDIDKENLNDMMNICKKNIEIIQGIIDYIEEKDKVIDEATEYINHYKEYSKINNFDYLKGREEINTLDEEQINELLEILERAKEVK